ncbi:hypothetical protein ACWGIV_19860 [Streptomyces sp. NPDC054844]
MHPREQNWRTQTRRSPTPHSGTPSCPELKALHAHVRGFAEILQSRSGQHLKDWITATRTAGPRLHAFASGLEKDWDAVVQGLSTRWNFGPVEDRVNHNKVI